MRALMRVLVVMALSFIATSRVSAQATMSTPFDAAVRRHYYDRLAKKPFRALGYELIFPGAGGYYTGVYAPAVCTLALSLAGAGVWIAGARRDKSTMMWSGIGVFAGARAFGIVSAPLGAMLLNAAFRRQLGLTHQF